MYGECFAWVKLYRRELFDTIRYPVGMTHEDVATTHRLIHAARRIYSLDDHLYHYRIDRPGSITAPLNNRSRSDIREMFASKIRDLCSWGYEELARKDALTLLVKYGWRNPEQKPYVEIVKRIKGWGPAEFSTAQKLLAAAFRLSPALFDLICAATNKRIRNTE